MKKQDILEYLAMFIWYIQISWKTKLAMIALIIALFKLSVWTGDGTGFIFVLPFLILVFLMPEDIFSKKES